MVSLETPVCDFGKKAPNFELPGVDGRSWSLQQCMGEKGLLIMFICNHCPYVKAIIDRLCRDVTEIQAMGIGVAAIMSNDTHAYPEDSYANMQIMAKRLNFSFPYLYDPTQNIARQYGAACTPDFLGFNRDLELQYRGRLDSNEISPSTPDAHRELVEAMRLIVNTGKGPDEQVASSGCSIKWRN